MNTYGYVGGNPLNEYDKYGLESVIGGGWTGLDTDWGAGPGALSFGLGVNYQYGPFGTASNVTVGFDSDGKLWFQVDDSVSLANIYYDYFIADYEKNAIWLRENYSNVKVVL